MSKNKGIQPMMKRFLVLLLLVGTLVGCSSQSVSSDSVRNEINSMIKNRDQYIANVHKDYYSYYLPKTLAKHTTDQFNTTLMLGEHQILLSISPEEVMLDHDEDVTSNVESESFEKSIEYLTNLVVDVKGVFASDREQLNYHVYAYPIENHYFVGVKVGYAKMQVIVPESLLHDAIEDMFLVAMTLHVDTRSVVSNFKEVEREVLGATTNLNVEYAPVNGFLSNSKQTVDANQGNVDIINKMILVNRDLIKPNEENPE